MTAQRDEGGKGDVDAGLQTKESEGPPQRAEGATSEAQAGLASRQSAAPAQPVAGAPQDKVAVLGHAAWLMSHSPLHKYFFLADLEWMLVPPVAQQQFRLWMGQGKPEAFATWALVDETVEARLKTGHKRLAPNEWTSGPNLWLMDLVAPFGGIDNALKDLKTALQGRSIKTLRLNPETQKMEVVEL